MKTSKNKNRSFYLLSAFDGEYFCCCRGGGVPGRVMPTAGSVEACLDRYCAVCKGRRAKGKGKGRDDRTPSKMEGKRTTFESSFCFLRVGLFAALPATGRLGSGTKNGAMQSSRSRISIRVRGWTGWQQRQRGVWSKRKYGRRKI